MNLKPQRHLSSARAFTLIELMLVMAMLLIVLAVSFPSLRGFFRGRNLDSEARRFLSLTRYAQNRAVSEGYPMVLWIDVKEGTYGMQAQTGYLDEDDKSVEFELDETLRFEVTRPTLIRATATQRNETASVAGNLPAIRFTSDGFYSDSSPERIVIRQDDKDEVVIAKSDNRLSYEIQTSVDPVTATSWAFKQTATKSSATPAGLTSGTKIWVRVRAIGAGNTPGPWSDPATKVVP